MFQIEFLGTAGGSASPTRGFTLITIKINELTILFDVGEGATHQLLKQGYDLLQIEHCFISHLHLDHVLGVPSLLLKKWLLDKNRTTSVYIPKGSQPVMDGIMRTFPQRMLKELQWNLQEVESGATITIQDEISISTLELPHDNSDTQYHRNLAYRLDYRKNSIVYSGDTSGDDTLIDFAKDATIFICEATFPNEQKALATRVGHLTAGDAGRYAQLAGVKKLVLTHREPEKSDDERLFQQAQQYYSGPITLAYDGTKILL